jgi:transposase
MNLAAPTFGMRSIIVETFVGLDVSDKDTAISIVDGTGQQVWRGKVKTDPAAIAEMLGRRAPQAAKIGLETGPLSTWLWHSLNDLGLPVICMDARHAKAGLTVQINKTDENDALGLAQLVRTGWYREVTVKSLGNHMLRGVLGARAQLVSLRIQITTQIRGLLKNIGVFVSVGRRQTFEAAVEEAICDSAALTMLTAPLLAVWRTITAQIRTYDTLLRKQALQNDAAKRMMTVPGVGPIVALAFVSMVDQPERFAKSKSVGAYLGLTPRRYQSGEKDVSGSISRTGDTLARAYLFEAANVLMTRVQKWTRLKAWGVKLARRVGINRARAAVARKMAVMMHRMLISKTDFQWSDEQPVTA